MFGGAVVLSVMGLVRNVRELFGLRVLQGGITGTVPASITLISSVVPKNQLGFSLGLMQMAVFSGGSIGPLLGGMVADNFGYRVPFAVTGGLLFTGGMLVLVGVKERFVRPTPEERAASAPVKEVLRTPGVMMLLLVYLLMNLSASFVMPIFPLFVEEIVGTPAQAATETGLLLGIQGVVAALSAVMVGRLSDRVGHRRTLITCTVIAGVMSFPHVVAHSVLQLALLRVAFGVAVGGMMPAMNAMVATIVARQRLGQAYGFTTTASALGWATGPLLGGLVAAAVGYRIPFVIMGVMLLLVALAQHRWLRSREAGSVDGGAA
jgi:DHA1 family multidrug resistance protein-like MFS transporter